MSKLLVVWKSDNDTDIHNFIHPYSLNSKRKGWMDDVEVLIWGASQEKIIEDESVQTVVTNLREHGVKLHACKYCADKVNATTVLESLGVNVMYTGIFLSDRQKDPEYEVISI